MTKKLFFYARLKLNQKIGHILMTLPLVFLAPAAQADVSINIGINVATYPNLVLVPGYPVYYDPQINSNYFFYDGLYWVFQDDNWYTSSWYNGPWDFVYPEDVPEFILRVPVRYYRQPPVYFKAWYIYEPPRWGEHWGRDWENRRRGWDHWDRHIVQRAAPLPVYQKQYSGNRYPYDEQQHTIQSERYHYKPHEVITRQHFQQQENDNSASRSQQIPQTQPIQTDQNSDGTIIYQNNGQVSVQHQNSNRRNNPYNSNSSRDERNRPERSATNPQSQAPVRSQNQDIRHENTQHQDLNRNVEVQRQEQKMETRPNAQDDSRGNVSRDQEHHRGGRDNGNRQGSDEGFRQNH